MAGATVHALLDERAAAQPARRAYAALDDETGELVEQVTWAEVRRDALLVAGALRQRIGAGARVLLAYDSGLAFVRAFFACSYAGLIAVPCPAPRKPYRRTLARLAAIARDCGAAAALADRGVADEMQEGGEHAAAGLDQLSWWDPLELLAERRGESPRMPDGEVTPETIAYLQYTSGSTSAPRGVVITQANVVANAAAIRDRWPKGPEAVMVSWLPLFHDMGLVMSVVEPAMSGVQSILLSPTAFIQRPRLWLKGFSDHRGTHAWAPNFAFELCARRIPPAEREGLDLSAWQVAGNGAEPVRRDTLERFQAVFRPCGLSPTVQSPCYGLAQATLFVSGCAPEDEPRVIQLDGEAYGQRRVSQVVAGTPRAIEAVSCGPVGLGMRLAIVDPATGRRCGPDQVGEIWVAGSSIAQGYWGQLGVPDGEFGATVDGDGPYLRTGDLGFVRDGALYISGRVKDVIIVRGRNIYPQDLEATAEKAHEGLQLGCGAAFSVEIEGEERVVLVQATRAAPADVEATCQAIAAAVSTDHDVALHQVVLVERGSIAKTSSGKIQRRKCRDQYVAGKLREIGRWPAHAAAPAPARPREGAAPSRDAILAWLRERVADKLRMPAANLADEVPIAAYGMDSLRAVEVAEEAGQRLGIALPSTIVYDFPTLGRLADHLASAAGAASRAAAPAPARPEPRAAAPAPARPEPPMSGRPAAPPPGAARSDAPPADEDAFAIVGIGCRFPGAASTGELEECLRGGRDTVGQVPGARADAFESAVDPRVRMGGFLDDVTGFDARFFGISDREARAMDPHQRLLLEVAWEALEDAGVAPASLAGSRTGTFVGISAPDYAMLAADSDVLDDVYGGTGVAHSIAANRLSYLLDLRGPSLIVDTACSSSLVALHLACDALRRGDCGMALVAGVNLVLTPQLSGSFARAQLLSPDGRSRSFDASANGYVRGEGAGVVVLKPLSRARADGDSIYAVVRATAVNHDGRTNGLTAPSHPAQVDLLRACLDRAGWSGGQVDFVEAHGSGTELGDAMEARALGDVMGIGRSADRPLLIGSIKSNIGHLEAAAGIAGLIKAALQLSRGVVFPGVHYRAPNRHVDLAALGLRVPTSSHPLRRDGAPVRAGVSSFGFGGANAHALLEAEPARAEERREDAADHLLPLSAASSAGLPSLARAYRSLLDRPEVDPAQLAWAAATRRAHHPHRAALRFSRREELVVELDALIGGREPPAAIAGERPRLAFVYTGQAGGWANAGRELLTQEPRYRDVFERCDEIVRREGGWSPLELVTSGELDRLAETERAQPMLTAMQIALTELWRSWGVEPAAVVGHSVGEIGAGYACGALSLDQAMTAATRRGRALEVLAGAGGMVVVALDAASLAGWLEPFAGRVSLAASNTPSHSVAAGDLDALAELEARWREASVGHRRLPTRYPFHGPQAAAARGPLVEALAGLEPARPRRLMVSTVTGREAGDDLFSSDYWVRHLTSPVRLVDALTVLIEGGHTWLLEVGPDVTLEPALRECLRSSGRTGWASSSLRRGMSDRGAMLSAVAGLYERGHAIDWAGLHGGRSPRVSLPDYPWDRQSFPLPVRRAAPRAPVASAAGPRVNVLAWRPAAAAAPSDEAGSWLVLADRGGAGERLAGRLRARGADVEVARAPWPADLAGLRQQIRAALARPRGPLAGIAFLGALDASVSPDAASVDYDLRVSGLAALALAQELERDGAPRPARVWCVTRRAHRASQADRVVEPAGRAAWGAVMSCMHELPARGFGLVDLEATGDDDLDALAEALRAPGVERLLARRGGSWWAPHLAPAPARSARFVADPDGAYAVLGGLGALGRRTARWLVDRGARRIALIARRPPDAAAERLLADLRGQGCRIEVLSAELADGAALAAALDRAASAMGPLRGIIHAAGVLRDATVANLADDAVAEVLAPKTVGALVAVEEARRRSIDLVVLFSSVAGTFGAPGQSSYAMANGFLDGIAEAADGGPRVVSAAWGPWAEEGMAARAGTRMPGLPAMAPAEAIGLLDALVTGAPAHALAMSIDPGPLGQALPALAPLVSGERAPAGPPMARPDAPQPGRPPVVTVPLPAPPRGAAPKSGAILEAIVAAMASALFTTPDRIDVDRRFMDQGLDSLTGVDVRNRLQQSLGIEIPIAAIWNYPTARELAGHLEERAAGAARSTAAPSATTGDEGGDLAGQLAAAVADVERLTDEEAALMLRGRNGHRAQGGR